MAEPTKAEQIKACIEQLRQTMKVVAGGTDPRVEEILAKMEEVLTPKEPS